MTTMDIEPNTLKLFVAVKEYMRQRTDTKHTSDMLLMYLLKTTINRSPKLKKYIDTLPISNIITCVQYDEIKD